MPTKWRDASFHDLLAEGGFLVSASRKGGVTEFIRVKSIAGEPCIIQAEFPGAVNLLGPKNANMHLQDGRIELHLEKGAEAFLYSGEKPDSFEISELQEKFGEKNAWGVNSRSQSNN